MALFIQNAAGKTWERSISRIQGDNVQNQLWGWMEFCSIFLWYHMEQENTRIQIIIKRVKKESFVVSYKEILKFLMICKEHLLIFFQF